MDEREIEIAGLRAIEVGPRDAALAVLVLHGREMGAEDLSPFARSLGVAARFVFPDGPLPGEHRARSWWPVDSEARARRLAHGAPDLAETKPEGRVEARAYIDALRRALVPPAARFAIVGFSQGGMLAMEHALHTDVPPDALALLSSTRVAFEEWKPRLHRLRDMPVLVTHGTEDAELAFAAGEGLRDAALEGGANVTWVPFEGTHDVPLVVWRAVRRLLRSIA